MSRQVKYWPDFVYKMEEFLLDMLKTWFAQHSGAMAELGLSVDLGQSLAGQEYKRSIRVDIDSDRRVGQVVLWETGEVEMTLGSVDSDDITVEVGEVESFGQLEEWLRKLLLWNGVDKLTN